MRHPSTGVADTDPELGVDTDETPVILRAFSAPARCEGRMRHPSTGLDDNDPELGVDTDETPDILRAFSAALTSDAGGIPGKDKNGDASELTPDRERIINFMRLSTGEFLASL